MQYAYSGDSGANWNGPYNLWSSGNHERYPAIAITTYVGYRLLRHPPVAWLDNRNNTSVYDVYYDTLNDPPAITFGNVWPASGSTIHVFAPRLDWIATGYTDPDGDAVLGYWWKAWTGSEPAGWTGGPVKDTLALPWFTAPGVTYSWRVAVDDGYNQVQEATAWTFSIGTISHQTYYEGFDDTVTPVKGESRGYTYAAWESWEDATFPPAGWTNSSPGWQQSSTYAYRGSYSAWSTYTANLTTYSLASPPLDLRGSTTAYYNHVFRGSSESGYDFSYVEASARGGAPWRVFDQVSADWNGGWWTYPEGYMDLSVLPRMVGSNTGKV